MFEFDVPASATLPLRTATTHTRRRSTGSAASPRGRSTVTSSTWVQATRSSSRAMSCIGSTTTAPRTRQCSRSSLPPCSARTTSVSSPPSSRQRPVAHPTHGDRRRDAAPRADTCAVSLAVSRAADRAGTERLEHVEHGHPGPAVEARAEIEGHADITRPERVPRLGALDLPERVRASRTGALARASAGRRSARASRGTRSHCPPCRDTGPSPSRAARRARSARRRREQVDTVLAAGRAATPVTIPGAP